MPLLVVVTARYVRGIDTYTRVYMSLSFALSLLPLLGLVEHTGKREKDWRAVLQCVAMLRGYAA